MNKRNPIIINLTPHDIVYCHDPRCIKKTTIPRSGTIARVEEETEEAGHITYNGEKMRLVKKHYKEVKGLPDPRKIDYIIVSNIVAETLKHNPEWKGKILTPDTGTNVVRDPQGKIKGVKALIKH